MYLLAWWNLIFVLPFLAALLYLLLQMSGLASAEHDAALDHDLAISADHDLGEAHVSELSHDHEPDADSDSLWSQALGVLGVGKVPLSLLLMCLGFTWGFFGWASNEVLRTVLPHPGVFIWISLVVALVTSIGLTGGLARLLARIMPSTQSFAETNRQLEGRTATVLFDVTEHGGAARLRDSFGNLLDVSCRVYPGDESVEAGSEVLLISYDESLRSFLVCPNPFDADKRLLSTPKSPKRARRD